MTFDISSSRSKRTHYTRQRARIHSRTGEKVSMVQDQSFGVIPFIKQEHGYLVLLVKQRRAKYWAFPKGHAEENESPEDAARRELKEETGVERCMILPDVKLYSRYRFPQDGKVVAKTVVYFVGLIPSGIGGGGSTFDRTTEISRTQWLPYKEALAKVTHRQSREMLEKAYQFVTKPMAKVIQQSPHVQQKGPKHHQRKRYGL